MSRRILAALLCLLAPATVLAAQRPSRARAAAPPAAAAAARVDLSAPFAELLSSDTFLYFEINNLAAAAEEIGGVDTLHALLVRTFEKNGDQFPLTLHDFRLALGSSMAVGVTIPHVTTSVWSVDPVIVGVARTPSPEVFDVIAKAIAKEQQKRRAGTKTGPTVQLVGGVSVTTIPGYSPKSDFAYASSGNTIVFGTPSGVTGLLRAGALPPTKRLSDVPGFASASSRATDGRQIFAYLNGGPLVKAFDEGVDSSFTGKTVQQRSDARAQAEALKSFIGLSAIRAGSVSALVTGGNVSIQGSFELDRTKGGLVSILSDAPPISMRSATLLPAETDFVSASSVDAIAIYDLVLRVLTPGVAKALGMPPPPEAIAKAEAMLGMRIRDDLLASFGNEVVFAVWEPDSAPIARVSEQVMEESKKDASHIVALFEVRNPETIDAALSKTFASEGENTTRDTYRDAPLTLFGTTCYAYVEGFGVIGDKADVEHVIDSVRDGHTLATTADYAAAVGTVPENVLAGAYMSPHFFELAAKEIDKTTGVPRTVEPVKDGLFFTIQKDASGVFGTLKLPIPNLRTLLEKEKRSVVSRL